MCTDLHAFRMQSLKFGPFVKSRFVFFRILFCFIFPEKNTEFKIVNSIFRILAGKCQICLSHNYFEFLLSFSR